MATITISEEQERRFGELRSELASQYSGQYATVTDEDVMAYLLDLADSADGKAEPPDAPDTDADATASGRGDTPTPESTDGRSTPSGGSASDGDKLESMLQILETHGEKWQESDGEEPYEVELPDGGTETARTKDDVKAILFRHYQ